MMTEEHIYKQVINKINGILDIAKRKNWAITVKPFIDRPATIAEINSVEEQIGKIIPDDLRKLFLFSRHLEFSYQFDETLSEEFRQNFSGDIYWNLNSLAEQYTNFQEWVKASIDPAYNGTRAIEITEKLWQDKLPLMHVPNGDVIAIGDNHSEIIYFSHEGDAMHGKMLGNNLWNFLDFYSRIGFAGSEDWQLEPFFDFDKNMMVTQGDKVERFAELLEK
ncbi:SMI1/KNR4 family protein [Siphonobacter sp. SORGH_AS_1065]|uniref:SMI1/KNR4 family protein n=1 Tax=Siphonobacter sp. SORGH_AS_1065 TaxID=3041795 RepID=UPI0027813F01|nr:SMI1/KNR4 family protein [Siphonobacter sp. SORGH_AS_1065]MDQ1088363.1 cell wall assembly regulator SMI1 [Siphonobacter sp. SORGH_AS_1065]